MTNIKARLEGAHAAPFMPVPGERVSWAAGGDEPGARVEEHAAAALVAGEGGAQLAERVPGPRGVQRREEILGHLQREHGAQSAGGVGSVVDGYAADDPPKTPTPIIDVPSSCRSARPVLTMLLTLAREKPWSALPAERQADVSAVPQLCEDRRRLPLRSPLAGTRGLQVRSQGHAR